MGLVWSFLQLVYTIVANATVLSCIGVLTAITYKRYFNKKEQEEMFSELIRTEKKKSDEYIEKAKKELNDLKTNLGDEIKKIDDLKRQEKGKTAELKIIQEKLTENVSEKLMALYEKEEKALIKWISEEQKKLEICIQKDKETLAELKRNQNDEFESKQKEMMPELKKNQEKTFADLTEKQKNTLDELKRECRQTLDDQTETEKNKYTEWIEEQKNILAGFQKTQQDELKRQNEALGELTRNKDEWNEFSEKEKNKHNGWIEGEKKTLNDWKKVQEKYIADLKTNIRDELKRQLQDDLTRQEEDKEAELERIR
ncbi:Hypothetical predicted protein, partial [Mytilus galloprovincialis]